MNNIAQKLKGVTDIMVIERNADEIIAEFRLRTALMNNLQKSIHSLFHKAFQERRLLIRQGCADYTTTWGAGYYNDESIKQKRESMNRMKAKLIRDLATAYNTSEEEVTRASIFELTFLYEIVTRR